jgi:hypothetical protein
VLQLNFIEQQQQKENQNMTMRTVGQSLRRRKRRQINMYTKLLR